MGIKEPKIGVLGKIFIGIANSEDFSSLNVVGNKIDVANQASAIASLIINNLTVSNTFIREKSNININFEVKKYFFI